MRERRDHELKGMKGITMIGLGKCREYLGVGIWDVESVGIQSQ